MDIVEPIAAVPSDSARSGERRWGRPSRGILPGLLGGLVMMLIVCLLASANGHAAYRPVLVIASILGGSSALTGGAGTVVLGLLIHFAMSVALAMLFVGIVGRTTMARLLALGLFFGIFTWALAQFVVLPLLSPSAATQIGTVWSFFLGHVAYGLLVAAGAPTSRDLDESTR